MTPNERDVVEAVGMLKFSINYSSDKEAEAVPLIMEYARTLLAYIKKASVAAAMYAEQYPGDEDAQRDACLHRAANAACRGK